MNYDQAKAKFAAHVATANRQQTATVLHLGQLATVAILARLRQVPPANRRGERAATIADLAAVITESSAPGGTLSQWLRWYGTAQALGLKAARDLPLRTLRAFAPLTKRDTKKETWTIRKAHHQFALDLWSKAPTMTSTAIVAEISHHLGKTPRVAKRPPTTAPIAATFSPSQPTFQQMLAAVDTLSHSEQNQLMNAIHNAMAKRLQPPPQEKPKRFSILDRLAG